MPVRPNPNMSGVHDISGSEAEELGEIVLAAPRHHIDKMVGVGTEIGVPLCVLVLDDSHTVVVDRSDIERMLSMLGAAVKGMAAEISTNG